MKKLSCLILIVASFPLFAETIKIKCPNHVVVNNPYNQVYRMSDDAAGWEQINAEAVQWLPRHHAVSYDKTYLMCQYGPNWGSKYFHVKKDVPEGMDCVANPQPDYSFNCTREIIPTPIPTVIPRRRVRI